MASRKEAFKFDPERIAYWYFRLNGCFILDNFLVHHEKKGYMGTEVDVLAMRFPHRKELAISQIQTTGAMKDDLLFEKHDGRIQIFFVEVTSGQAKINKSWLDPKKQNMERLLHAVGAFSLKQVEEVAKSLYTRQSYEDDYIRVKFVAVGRNVGEGLPQSVETLELYQMLDFIYVRLREYDHQKSQNRQWDETGRELFCLMRQNWHCKESFIESVSERID